MAQRTPKPALVWFLPFYLPAPCSGTERSAHALNRYLVDHRGFRVVVCSGNAPGSGFEGVEAFDMVTGRGVSELVGGASVLATAYYPDYMDLACWFARKAGKPLLHLVDSDRNADRLRLAAQEPRQYVVFGSAGVRDGLGMAVPSIVVHTPVNWRDYEGVSSTRRFITLLNVNDNKGGRVLIDIARRMPEREFLGVEGSYGEMIIDRSLPNLAYRPLAPRVTDILADTAILLMPSRRESWGRVAIEAMAAGIPVIAHPASGPLEVLGAAGIFADRDDVGAWVRSIRELDEPARYAAFVARGRRRARELDPAAELEAFGDFVERIIGR
jgi:glycosyltransferase involved in cell wall biosynthesis